jgi:hypothetical protein
MSATTWAFFSGVALAGAAGPWPDTPSHGEAWIDAILYGCAAFYALSSVISAFASAQGKSDASS